MPLDPNIWLYIGMGSVLAAGGPVGLLVGFAVVGILVLSMMASVRELNSIFAFNFAIHRSKYV